jgi:arylsulfatase A-like enzyme
MHAGKESPFEEDTRVPMFVRGPGIKGNQTDAVSVSSHVDFPATWVTLAGADYRKLPTDGQPMPLHRWAEEGKESYFEAFKAYKQYESVPVEYCECAGRGCTVQCCC